MKKLFLLCGLLVVSLAWAQQYSVDWYKVAGGGGTSTNGQYSVSGTIGQPDASAAAAATATSSRFTRPVGAAEARSS